MRLKMMELASNRYEDFYILENQLSKSEIAWLRSEYNKMKSSPELALNRVKKGNKQNRLFIIKPENSLRNKLETHFQKLFPFPADIYDFYSLNFYLLENPYALHCDNLGPEKGFYQAVIPLEIEPNKPTYTIVFDQTSNENTEWVAPIYGKPKDYKPFYNKPIFDPNYYGHWTNEYKIDEQDGVRFWGDTWKKTFREAYKGFSIKIAYQWSIGDIFLFESQFNHCASELAGLGVKHKSGLLICLRTKDQ